MKNSLLYTVWNGLSYAIYFKDTDKLLASGKAATRLGAWRCWYQDYREQLKAQKKTAHNELLESYSHIANL